MKGEVSKQGYRLFITMNHYIIITANSSRYLELLLCGSTALSRVAACGCSGSKLHNSRVTVYIAVPMSGAPRPAEVKP